MDRRQQSERQQVCRTSDEPSSVAGSTAMIPPVPILRYYSISDDPGGATAPYAVSRRQLGAQLDALVRLDFTILTVGELLLARANGLPLPERTAVITFDDGFADFAANAWPELAQRQLTATLYVTPGRLGGTSSWLESYGSGELPMLTRRQLVAL